LSSTISLRNWDGKIHSPRLPSGTSKQTLHASSTIRRGFRRESAFQGPLKIRGQVFTGDTHIERKKSRMPGFPFRKMQRKELAREETVGRCASPTR